MAKAPTKKDSGSSKVTRIKATDSNTKAPKPAATKVAKTTKSTKVKPAIDSKRAEDTAKAEVREKRGKFNPLRPIVRYFKGSWYELMQVRWPDRKSTWSMTGALIAFTLFFVVIILFADYGFSKLFNLILGSN